MRNTASHNDDNIVYKAQQEGVSTTVGWTVSVGSDSHADSFSYTDNSVSDS